MKIVYLHGIGDGDPDFKWLAGLNRGLQQAGHDPVERDQVVAPRYSSYLRTEGISAQLPPVTAKPKDESESRCEFERRQARVQRLLHYKPGVRAFGFDWIPNSAWNTIPALVIDAAVLFGLQQVHRYIHSEDVRGAVMLHILDDMPSYGDIILIGHSLGSVIAIDLLDHLPEQLHVRRFITTGSPASIRALHVGSERLLKKFPYSRVDDWSNFLNVHDVVTGGRGLASIFPGAQDFVLDISGPDPHGAGTYLGDPAVAGLVAEMLYPSTEPVPSTTAITPRMNDAQASALLMQHFAEAVARNIKNEDRAGRYRATLKLLRDDLAAQLTHYAAASHLLAPELHELAAGRLPPLPQRWELHQAVGELVVLALTNCVTPYEFDVADAPMRALAEVAVELGFTSDTGNKIGTAIKDVQTCIAGEETVQWGRLLTAAAGVALVAAAPIGLAIAAPATAFGAAAITGALAAFGPGGMIGGLATLGGLAGTGAAMTAAAAAVSPHEPGYAPNLEKLTLRVTTEHARKMLDLPYDTTLWYQLADFESQISRAINRLSPFSDHKSEKIVLLTAAKVAVQALIRFMIEKSLAPNAITDGENPPDSRVSSMPTQER